eukprot:4519471-Alexandrium_andersonii.AAC.1
MCIRDSLAGAPSDAPSFALGAVRVRVRPRRAQRGHYPWGPWVGGWSLGAVSYTHLTLPTICSV